MQDVQPRLAALEQRLAGTFNLAGHLVAVADMAGELGVPLPNLDASGGCTAGAAIAAHGRGAALSSAPGSAPTASGSSTRLAGLFAQLEASRAEARALKAELQVGRVDAARMLLYCRWCCGDTGACWAAAAGLLMGSLRP
jgi:hypothetical protein